MPQIYVIYRPEDTRKKSKEIIDSLQTTYGASHVKFPNFDGYVDVYDIERHVQKTDFLLVIIGNYWADLVDENGVNLLASVYDPVHMAIATAISARKRIIPILVDGATMPYLTRVPRELRALVAQEPVKIDKNVSVSKALNKGLKDVVKRESLIKMPDFVPQMKRPQLTTSPSTPQPRLRQPTPRRDWQYWLKTAVIPVLALATVAIVMVFMIVPFNVQAPNVESNYVTPVLATTAPITHVATLDIKEETPTDSPTQVIVPTRPAITVANTNQLIPVNDGTVSISQTDQVLFSADETLFIFISPELQEVHVREIASGDSLAVLTTAPYEPLAITLNADETLLHVLMSNGRVTTWGVPMGE